MNHEQKVTDSLFGLDKDFLLKNQLLQILDNAPNYLSSSELSAHMTGISVDIIQQTCRSIRDDLQNLYQPEECRLDIHPTLGIRFFRREIPLKQVIDFYATQELSYILIQELFHYRELISYDFYEEQHVSESTLRRKIKVINQSLNKYHIHITFAQKIKLTGSEIAIRSFYFYFLFLVYRQLPALPNIAEQGFFESRTSKIQDHLKLTLTPKEFNVFSLLYYTNEHGIHSGIPLGLTEAEKTLFNQFDLPVKPFFLNNWSLDDWQYFLIFTASTNLFQHDFEVKSRNLIKPLFTFESKTWIHAFQLSFHQLTSEEQELIYQTVSKDSILTTFISIEDEFFRLFRMIDFEIFQQRNPYFYKRFQQFWDDFRVKVPNLDTSTFKFTSLMLAIYFAPLDTQLYSLQIAIYSEVSSLFAKYLADRLNAQFKVKYDFHFTDDFEQADLIISTFPLSQEETGNTPSITIDPLLNQNDLLRIDQTIQQFIKDEQKNLF